jgi:hypothetical protein
VKKNKQIKEIAEMLPPVIEQTISGFYQEDGKVLPNIVSHPINHERRLRKAYEKLGMEGIHQYLDMIKKLQQERRDAFER